MLTLGIVLAVVTLILGVRYIDHLDKRSKKAERELENKLSGEWPQRAFRLPRSKSKEKKYIRIQ